jgi:hypothetical protein
MHLIAGLTRTGAHPSAPVTSDVSLQNTDLLHFCTPVTPTLQNSVAAFMSSHQDHSANECSEWSPRHSSDYRQFSSFIGIKTAESPFQGIRPIHCSPALRPQRDDFDVLSMNWSLGGGASSARLAADAACDSPQESLIQGKALLKKSEPAKAAASLEDVCKPICKAPAVPCLKVSEHHTYDKWSDSTLDAIVDSDSAIVITRLSLNSAISSSSDLSLDAPNCEKVCSNSSSFNILSGSYSLCSTAPFRAHTPPGRDLKISGSRLVGVGSTGARHGSEQAPSATLCSSHSIIEPFTSLSHHDAALAIAGNRCSFSRANFISERSQISNSASSDSMDALTADLTSIVALASPRNSCFTPRLTSVPATTPRASASVYSLMESKLVHQSMPSFAQQIDLQQGALTSQNSTKTSQNHSKLHLQSPYSLQPTLMSSDHHHLSSNVLAAQQGVSDSSRASLPWFVSDAASGSAVHAACGACYMKRQSSIAVSSAKATLHNAAPKVSPTSPERSVVVRIVTPNDDCRYASSDEDIAAGNANSIVSHQTELDGANDSLVFSSSHSGPNHLKLLASRLCHLPDVRPQNRNEHKHHHPYHPSALIVPEAQSFRCRLERDSQKFANRTLPLHVKTLQRNERRHQRVILGADAIRAQKLDL